MSINFKNFNYTALATLWGALVPLSAGAWSCTDPSGQTWSSASPSYCSNYYPDCSSLGDVPGSCLAPNFQRSASAPSPSAPAAAAPKAEATIRGDVPTQTATPSQASPSLGGAGASAAIPAPATEANPYIATAITTEVLTSTATTANIVPLNSSDVTAAMAENTAAFERVNQLKTTMTTAKENHNQAVAYYSSPDRDPNAALKFLSLNDFSSVSGDVAIADNAWDFGSTASNGYHSGVSSPGRIIGPNAAGHSYAAGGKAAKSSAAANAPEDPDVKALAKASLAAKVAALVANASLRAKVAAMLAAEGANPSDPDNAALSEALAQAEEAANTTGDKNGESTASLVEKAKAFASLFGGGEEKKTDRLSLMDEESQGEVNRLLASIGGDSMATPQGIGEPLFARVHTALTRNVIRGNVKAKR